MASRRPTTYRDAGVDTDAGDALVERIKPAVRRTMRPEVLGGLGGFGALVEIPLDRYRRPVMVSGTDGVGTKLRIAIETGRHDTIGIDLVAMCVNDVLVQGAEPLFFLDYYATGRLDVAIAARVIEGIVEGCLQGGCALVGGETAEMPGMYGGEDYDLAGFCVGLVEKDAIIDGHLTRPGDAIIGLASSGAHSNGYSLIRKLLADTGSGPHTTVGGANLHELLLAPTRIYVRAVQAVLRELPVHSIAHITGGGLSGNIPRTLPPGVDAVIDPRRWSRPAVFDWLQAAGRIEDAEMYRTFNCGLGMTLCVAPASVDRALTILAAHGESASVVGEVRPGDRGVVIAG
ncbi:MAG TPA: phosphoribosylformylglycinamidine cyclo-ligase [Burkholderiales bacterium]|nr:phosphoribosylformylglycinamidine cyclo-ligase [Burkholderiales bacterium]